MLLRRRQLFFLHIGSLMLILTTGAAARAPTVPLLHQDIQSGNINSLRTHIDQGADLAERDAYGFTPLHRALDSSKRDMAIELIQRGADINARTRDGASPLSLAIDKGYGDVVDLLLDRHASTESPGAMHSPIFSAIDAGNIDIFERLVRSRVAIDSRNGDGESPLYRASTLGHVPMVGRLLDLGADISAALPDRRTSLHAAVMNSHGDVADLLYAHGAAVSSADGEVGAYTTALVYRFAAEKEYAKRDAARSTDYLRLAKDAFLASQAELGGQADTYAGQVTRIRLLNVLSLALGQMQANAIAQTSVSGTGTSIVMLGGTGGQRSMRDAYRKLAAGCAAESQRMDSIRACVVANSDGSRACFQSPSK